MRWLGVCVRCAVFQKHFLIGRLKNWYIERLLVNCVRSLLFFPHSVMGRCLFIGPVHPPQLTGINLWIIILYQFPCASASILIWKHLLPTERTSIIFYCCHCLEQLNFCLLIFSSFSSLFFLFPAFLFIWLFCSVLSVNLLDPLFRKYVGLLVFFPVHTFHLTQIAVTASTYFLRLFNFNAFNMSDEKEEEKTIINMYI